MKGLIECTVDHVARNKDKDPVPKDVIKSAATNEQLHTTYNQAFRAVRATFTKKLENDAASFQLIIPYLNRFKVNNPGSTAKYDVDANNHLYRVFVCPGFMQHSLKFVRPVMSLDACHLYPSSWKGTLYVASVKTSSNETYPVALAVMDENENEEGWDWFLTSLRSSIDILAVDHPKSTVTYKYFSFVSDRQKGLTNALTRVFPENHSYFCSVHIARNVERLAGTKVSKFVHSLSTTFSHRLSSKLLSKIQQISARGKTIKGVRPVVRAFLCTTE
jgi:MULE transposase domain